MGGSLWDLLGTVLLAANKSTPLGHCMPDVAGCVKARHVKDSLRLESVSDDDVRLRICGQEPRPRHGANKNVAAECGFAYRSAMAFGLGEPVVKIASRVMAPCAGRLLPLGRNLGGEAGGCMSLTSIGNSGTRRSPGKRAGCKWDDQGWEPIEMVGLMLTTPLFVRGCVSRVSCTISENMALPRISDLSSLFWVSVKMNTALKPLARR